VCLVGLGLELGVELHRDKPRVIFDLDDFHQVAPGVDTADQKPAALQLADQVNPCGGWNSHSDFFIHERLNQMPAHPHGQRAKCA
jgi:hypothetical protein